MANGSMTIKEKDIMNGVEVVITIKSMFASDVRYWIASKLFKLAGLVLGVGNTKVKFE